MRAVVVLHRCLQGMINIVTFLIVAPELEKAWNSSILARYVVRPASRPTAGPAVLMVAAPRRAADREHMRDGVGDGVQHLRLCRDRGRARALPEHLGIQRSQRGTRRRAQAAPTGPSRHPGTQRRQVQGSKSCRSILIGVLVPTLGLHCSTSRPLCARRPLCCGWSVSWAARSRRSSCSAASLAGSTSGTGPRPESVSLSGRCDACRVTICH